MQHGGSVVSAATTQQEGCWFDPMWSLHVLSVCVVSLPQSKNVHVTPTVNSAAGGVCVSMAVCFSL